LGEGESDGEGGERGCGLLRNGRGDIQVKGRTTGQDKKGLAKGKKEKCFGVHKCRSTSMGGRADKKSPALKNRGEEVFKVES